MSQKYPTSKEPYQSSVEGNSLWMCCVNARGKRKNSYLTRTEAKVAAKTLNGRKYHCIFNPDIYHVTTKTKPVLNVVVSEHKIKSLKDKIENIEAEMAVLTKRIEVMTSETSLEEIEAVDGRWDKLSREKRKLAKVLEHETKRHIQAVAAA